MKKALLIILGAGAIFSANIATAQSYTVEKDTARGTIYNNGLLEIKNKITNTSPAVAKYTWQVIAHSLPTPAWMVNGFGVCDNELCVSYMNDGSFLPKTTLNVNPNESFDLKLQIEVAALPTGGPYYIVTSFTDGTTAAVPNPTFEIINRFPTGVATINRVKEDVIMYPNPARNELNVIYNGNTTIKNISVYNLIGKAVSIYKITGNNTANLDISGIPSGIYFVRLVDAQGRVVATRKFTHQ